MEGRMTATRRTLLRHAAALPLLGLAAHVRPAAAQAFPDRPIRLVVPYPPGQAADIIGRLLADEIRASLGQAMIVENRAGAGGAIGAEYIARAPADGTTLGIAAGGPFSIAPALNARLPYDPTRDFEPIVLIAASPQMFVVAANSPITSVAELVAAARARPSGIFYGSSGNGSTQHLAVEMFAAMAGVKLTHVPYRGSAPALNDLVAGQVGLVADTLPAVMELVRTGRLRALAVTSAVRMPFFPDVPTIAESGVAGYESTGWLGLVGPAGIPAPVLERLERAAVETVQRPAFQSRMADMAFPPSFRPRAGFRDFISAEVAKWRGVVQSAGITVEQ
jgi:tripartite-type tricarboxylate transporter receptor subunit TctC